uniref:Telomerase-binding protein EST1A n=1 Tax=Anopheles maculatus TaxID=74869 RepID=A0A182T9R0_9DIPT
MNNATVPNAVVSSSATSGSSRSIANKRQQQIYSPGSGPLRKTETTSSNRSHNHDQPDDPSMSARRTMEGSDAVASGSNRGRSSSELDTSVSSGRTGGSVNWRLEGQPSHANNHSPREEMNPRAFSASNTSTNNRSDRMQRDSRSVEPRYVSGSKKSSIPPLSHLENLAPRLQKKTLQDLGLPQNYLELKRAEYQAMSQTLPNRNSSRQNRGRARYPGGPVGGNSASYSNTYSAGRPVGGGGRHMNDEYYPRPRSRSSEVDTAPEQGYPPRRGQTNRNRRLDTGSNSRNSSCDRKDRSRGTPTGYAGDRNRIGTRYRQYSTDSSLAMQDKLSTEDISVSANDSVPLNDRNYETSGRFRRHSSRDRYANRSRDNSLKREVTDRQRDEGDNWRCAGVNGTAPSIDKTDQAIEEMIKQFESSIGIQRAPGVLVIPTRVPSENADSMGPDCGGGHVATKLLFDPKNPAQPIVVTRMVARAHPRDCFRRDEPRDAERSNYSHKISGGPAWYDPGAQQAKLLRHKELVYRVAEADEQLQQLIESGNLFNEWDAYVMIRQRLQQLLETFLVKEMRFAQDVNLEHHFWKLLFYGIVEQLRKLLSETQDEQRKRFLQERALEVVENGTKYFEHLLTLLEQEYRFNLDQFIGLNAASSVKGLRYALALVSSQKLFLYLGDLARYREQITEGHNFRKAKQWYVKAQQILPKNGRPYNQLALLSVYEKRKIDAVYFYMRSLMSSNPFESARESLMDLFNETKKKYENNQRKREEKLRARRKVKEQRFDGNLRREIWIHPDGGLRLHRTGPIYPIGLDQSCDTSDEEELHSLGSIELNKRFITSFLHVLGKLITKTG